MSKPPGYEIDSKNTLWDLDSQVDSRHGCAALAPPDDAGRLPSFSGGERRRVALLQAAARSARTAAARRAGPIILDAREASPGSKDNLRNYPRCHSDRHPPIATSSTNVTRLDSSSSIAARASPTRATTPPGLVQKAEAPRAGGAARRNRASARYPRESEWIAASPKARQAKSKARYQRYEDLLKTGEREADHPRRRSSSRSPSGSANNVVDFERP